jgi:hypothetical protein
MSFLKKRRYYLIVLLALIEPYMNQATDDWHSLMADPDDTEFLEIFINNFIRAMNEKGSVF